MQRPQDSRMPAMFKKQQGDTIALLVKKGRLMEDEIREMPMDVIIQLLQTMHRTEPLL